MLVCVALLPSMPRCSPNCRAQVSANSVCILDSTALPPVKRLALSLPAVLRDNAGHLVFLIVAPIMIRTRFAPSPTGYLHIGGVRTALYSWAFARHHGGQFILRVEDTDLERSTPESVKAILDGMQWVGLNHDEGPFYQTQRFDRYKAVIQQLIEAGQAYYCYCSKDELETMRAEMEARGEKPRYDRRWRPEPGKTLPAVPAEVAPVVRFKNPIDGVVA